MIKPNKMQILLFSLIPVGIFLLILTFKSVREPFSGDKILETPYITKLAEFKIEKPGIYSIWHQSQIFRRVPLDEFCDHDKYFIVIRENESRMAAFAGLLLIIISGLLIIGGLVSGILSAKILNGWPQ